MIASSENFLQFGAAFAQALFNGALVGIAVALAVYLFVGAHRGLNAASRHAAWYAALIVIAALPAVSLAVSLAHIQELSPAPQVHVASAHATTTAAALHASNAMPAAAAPTLAPALVQEALQPATIERAAIALAVALAVVASFRIGLLLVGLFGLARVKRASRIVDPSFAPTLAHTLSRDVRARAVHVRVSETLDAPAAAGFRTPAILLPAELVETLDSAALDQIAMHEYAHLRRYDDWTNLAQRFIERLFWFNPAIWFVSGRIDLEREIACDDWAVAGAEGVSSYAECLWHLARDGRLPVFAATAPGAFLTRNQITARIEHLLERHRDGAPTLRTAKLFGIAPVLAAALALVIGRAPAIALRVCPPPNDTHALVAVHAKPAVTVAVAPVAPVLPAVAPPATSRSSTVPAAPLKIAATPCPRAPQIHVRTHVVISRARVERTVQLALAANREAIATQVSAAVRATLAARNETIRSSVKRAMAANRSALARTIQRAVTASAPAVIATAVETDNLSDGTVDRNLLEHCTGCDLSGKNLRNADLHDLRLTGDDLSGADLRGANLRNAVLTGVDLSDAKLDGADLRNALLTGSSIDGASFNGARTDGIRLVGMQLTNAILANVSARSIIGACSGCDLSGLDLRGRDLHGITLDGADLHGTDLSGANLEGARFNGVDLSGVKFDHANLKNAQFNGCDLRGVNLNSAQTDGIHLQGSNLDSSDGSG